MFEKHDRLLKHLGLTEVDVPATPGSKKIVTEKEAKKIKKEKREFIFAETMKSKYNNYSIQVLSGGL